MTFRTFVWIEAIFQWLTFLLAIQAHQSVLVFEPEIWISHAGVIFVSNASNCRLLTVMNWQESLTLQSWHFFKFMTDQRCRHRGLLRWLLTTKSCWQNRIINSVAVLSHLRHQLRDTLSGSFIYALFALRYVITALRKYRMYVCLLSCGCSDVHWNFWFITLFFH